MKSFKSIFLIFFIIISSCEKSFKFSEKKGKRIDNINLNIENLVGNLTIYPETKYLYEIKKSGLMGDITTNFIETNLFLKIYNFTGEAELFLDKKKNISITSLIAGGSLTLSSKMKIDDFFCEMNSGYLLIDNTTIKKAIITNNFGEIKIKISKSTPVRLKLTSFVSYIDIPDSFIMSNGYFYYLPTNENIFELDIYLNMGKLEILF
ncbi:MAG: DUF4097 domain-containing protein [Brevinematales bacterium]|nr:DUF4097 domain-containing protein [Brevinematales bacterium]